MVARCARRLEGATDEVVRQEAGVFREAREYAAHEEARCALGVEAAVLQLGGQLRQSAGDLRRHRPCPPAGIALLRLLEDVEGQLEPVCVSGQHGRFDAECLTEADEPGLEDRALVGRDVLPVVGELRQPFDGGWEVEKVLMAHAVRS